MPTIGLALACTALAVTRAGLLAHPCQMEVARSGVLPSPIPVPAPETKFPEFGGDRARIAKDNVVIREDPDADSDKVAVVAIGRTAEVLAKKDGWYKLRFDGGTTGWARSDMLSAPKGVNVLAKDAPKGIPLTPNGPTAKDEVKPKKIVIEIDGDEEPDASIPNVVAQPMAAAPVEHKANGDTVDVSDLIETAKSRIGSPYVWGATGSRGSFDCSGFVGWVYARYGVDLPRTSIEQSGVGEAVGRDELQPGDLVFFHTRGGDRVSHVGIYIGNNNFIHASSGGGHVKISSLDEAYYSRNYAWARRVARSVKQPAKELLALTPADDAAQKIKRQAAEDEKTKQDKAVGVDVVGG